MACPSGRAAATGVVSLVHGQGGNKSAAYGPTLGKQIQMVRALARFPDETEVAVEAGNWRVFPNARETLTRIYGATAGADPAPTFNGQVVVKYAEPDRYSGRMRIRP